LLHRKYFNVTMADPYMDLILDEDLAQNEWPKKMKEIQSTSGHKSLMSQCITEEIFNKYKDHRTKNAGWSIARAINTGVMHPDSFVGIHGGDMESYDDFKDVFHPVVEKYHKGFKMDGSMNHVTDLDPSKMNYTLSDAAKHRIFSTRIRVARNLSMFPLNPGGTRKTREEVCELMEKVFAAMDPNSDLKGKLYRHTTMTAEEQQKLVDDHFMFRGRDRMQAASGYHEEWPHGRGIFHNADKTFLLWINEGDHIRIISMQDGGDVLEVFKRLERGVRAIEEGVKKITQSETPFMMHPILGSLTCCPSNLGTGMRASVHLRIPRVIQKYGFEGIDAMCRQRNCQARGSSGEHSEVVDRCGISNWRRLGFPEYQLVDDMIACVNFLVRLEEDIEAEILKNATTKKHGWPDYTNGYPSK